MCTPGRREARRAWDGARLDLWVRQPPVDGAANAAVVDEVARWLGVGRRSVRLVSGRASRTKVLEIDGPASLPPPDPLTPAPPGGPG